MKHLIEKFSLRMSGKMAHGMAAVDHITINKHFIMVQLKDRLPIFGSIPKNIWKGIHTTEYEKNFSPVVEHVQNHLNDLYIVVSLWKGSIHEFKINYIGILIRNNKIVACNHFLDYEMTQQEVRIFEKLENNLRIAIKGSYQFKQEVDNFWTAKHRGIIPNFMLQNYQRNLETLAFAHY